MKKIISGIREKLNPKLYFLICINVLLLLAFILVNVISSKEIKKLYTQQVADRWGNDKENYAQVSLFASPDRNLQKEDIEGIRSSIMEALAKESFEKKSNGARLWIDSYSGECETQIRKDWNNLTVNAMGVGNDFFLFHPMDFLSGSGMDLIDGNPNLIVVDENVAWSMFGSNDIVGMQVWMGNEIFTVSGVVSAEKDELSKLAYGSRNRIYMNYDKLKQRESGVKITCYEAVMPNPITNYAYYRVREACGLQDDSEENANKEKNTNPLIFDSCEVVENSSRFDWLTLFSKRKYIKLDSMRTNSIIYPYWENAARVVEVHQYRWLLLKLGLLIIPILTLIISVFYYWTHRSWSLRKIIKSKISQKIEASREERARRLEELKALEETEESSEHDDEDAELEEYETEEIEELAEYDDDESEDAESEEYEVDGTEESSEYDDEDAESEEYEVDGTEESSEYDEVNDD